MARKAAPALNGDPAEAAARHLREGRHRAAAAAVLPVLLLRAGDGDAACTVAAALLQDYHPAPASGLGPPVAEDLLAQTVERLIRLVQQQDEQLAALLDLLEPP